MNAQMVNRLVSWVRNHASHLRNLGIQVEEQFPDKESPFPGTATVGFVFNDIIVTYTVWENTIFQTALIVFNSETKRTVFFKDSEPAAPHIVDEDLADVVQKLANGEYSKMSSSL